MKSASKNGGVEVLTEEPLKGELIADQLHQCTGSLGWKLEQVKRKSGACRLPVI